MSTMRHLIALVLVACGAPEQAACPLPDPVPDAGPVDAGAPPDLAPCEIPVGGVTLTPATPDALADAVMLECHGYDCPAPVAFSQVVCLDGFGFTFSTAGSTVRLRLQGGEHWTAGASIDGAEIVGSMTYAGLSTPFDPAPTGHDRAAFALRTAIGTVSGTLAAAW